MAHAKHELAQAELPDLPGIPDSLAAKPTAPEGRSARDPDDGRRPDPEPALTTSPAASSRGMLGSMAEACRRQLGLSTKVQELPRAAEAEEQLAAASSEAPKARFEKEAEDMKAAQPREMEEQQSEQAAPTDTAGVPQGIRLQFFLDFIEEKREWLEQPASFGKGRKNMYDICPEVIIERTTCDEQVLTLSEEDAGRIASSLEEHCDTEQSIFLPGSLQCRAGVHLGGINVEGLAIEGILCDGGDQRREYWAASADRQKCWKTTAKHGRVAKGPAEIPAHLQTCEKLGEKSARRQKKLLKEQGTVVVLRKGVAYAHLDEPGEFGPLSCFASHFWGEETLEFARTLHLHAKTVHPSNPGALVYYICTFCNSQHSVDLGDDWRQSPFNRALEYVAARYHARSGPMYRAVMLFDKSCTTLKRKWCIFETFRCQALGLELDLYCTDGALTRTSESEHAKEIQEQVMNVDMMTAACSEKEDELKIDGAISEHHAGWTGVVSKVKMQVMDHLSFVAHLAVTRDAFTGQQVEPEQGIELEGSAGKVSMSEIIDGCMQACLSACTQSSASVDPRDAADQAQMKRVLITGRGGTGKTVITREIIRAAVKLAREKALRLTPLRVPLAELARYAKGQGDMLQAWAGQAFGKDGQELFQDSARSSQLLLLLDGLDEAGTDRRRIISWLEGWLRQNSHRCACVIVTSRPGGTDQVVDEEGKEREPSKSSVLHASEKYLITQDSFPQGSQILFADERDIVTGTSKVAACEQGFVFPADCGLQAPGCRVRVTRKDPDMLFSPAITLHYSDKNRAEMLLERAWQHACGAGADGVRGEKSVFVARADGERWQNSMRINWYELLDWPAAAFPCRACLAVKAVKSEDAMVDERWARGENGQDAKEDLELPVEACGDSVFVSAAGLAPGDKLLPEDTSADVDPELLAMLGGVREATSVIELLPTQGAFKTFLEGPAISGPAPAAPAALSELTLRAELSEQLHFRPLQLLPLSPQIAARISKVPEELLQTLPDAVWGTPLMASILGRYRQQQEDMHTVAAELDLMKYAVEVLITQAEERTGRQLKALGPRCLEKLQAGHRLLLKADFEDQVVFQEAQRGHLRLLEPVAGESAVQVYHLKMHEFLAAEAWKAANLELKEAFNLARDEPMLRGAARYLVMLETAGKEEAVVDLCGCNLGAADVEALRGALLCRGRLRILLANNTIGPDGFDSLAAALAACGSGLTALEVNLYDSQINDAEVASLAEALGGLLGLRELRVNLGLFGQIYDRGLSEAGARSLAGALRKLPSLEKLTLELCENKLGDDGAAFLADALGALTRLRRLEVNLCKGGLSEAGGRSLADALRKLPNLEELFVLLDQNRLGAAAASFGDALGGLAKLRELTVNLERNGAGEEGARSLGDALKKLPSLEKLKVYLLDNKLGEAGARCVIDAVRKLPKLEQLTLDFRLNDFGAGGEAYAEFSAALDALPVADKSVLI